MPNGCRRKRKELKESIASIKSMTNQCDKGKRETKQERAKKGKQNGDYETDGPARKVGQTIPADLSAA